MGMERLELSLSCEKQILNLQRLPIPPHPQVCNVAENTFSTETNISYSIDRGHAIENLNLIFN